MGRYYYSKKEEADSLHQVSVFFFKKHGYFNWGWRSGTINWSRNGENTGSIGVESNIFEEDNFVKFKYTQTDRFSGEKTEYDYKIPLTTTPCYFGGKRYWFICPFNSQGVYCGKRVGVLFLSDKFFACRHCNNLSYNSRNLSGIFKAVGQTISEPDLQELRSKIKRKYYDGKPTRQFMRFLKKERKAFFQLRSVVEGLKRVYKRS